MKLNYCLSYAQDWSYQASKWHLCKDRIENYSSHQKQSLWLQILNTHTLWLSCASYGNRRGVTDCEIAPIRRTLHIIIIEFYWKVSKFSANDSKAKQHLSLKYAKAKKKENLDGVEMHCITIYVFNDRRQQRELHENLYCACFWIEHEHWIKT